MAAAQHRAVIRDAVIHFHGRLPLQVDLHALPGPSDQSLLATNVRTRDGKRPSFVEQTESWFLFPLREVMVIELPHDVVDGLAEATAPVRREVVLDAAGEAPLPIHEAEVELDTAPIEPDEDLLARIRQL